MVICIGDIHASDNRPWSYNVSKEVVDYIIHSPHNNSGNSLVLLGDLTESAFLSGQIYELLLKLFSGLKYSKVYILVGNHDKKANKQGKLVLSYKFLQGDLARELFPNTRIEVVSTRTVATIEGIDCLLLPYVFSDSGHGFETYEEISDDKHYGVIFGHFTDTSDMAIKDRTVDISHLKSDYVCLGHQHNPGNNYIGSVVPNSTSEQNKNRSIWCFSKDTQGVYLTKEPIPNICDYHTVTFPENLPKVEAQYPIWTVLECASEDIAKEQYGDIFVLKCIYKAVMDIQGLQDMGVFGSKEAFTNEKLFAMFKEGAKYDDPSILQVAESYMTG